MEAPRTYAQWSQCLERLAAGNEDEACIHAMSQGELSWTGGVGPLFAERLADEFNARLTSCSDRLTRDLRQGRDEASVVRAILNARHALFFLHRLARLPVFAQTLRTHLEDALRKFAERAQRSLEDSAKSDSSGRLGSVLRHNNLLRYDSQSGPGQTAIPAKPSANVDANANANAGGRRRNILI